MSYYREDARGILGFSHPHQRMLPERLAIEMMMGRRKTKRFETRDVVAVQSDLVHIR